MNILVKGFKNNHKGSGVNMKHAKETEILEELI